MNTNMTVDVNMNANLNMTVDVNMDDEGNMDDEVNMNETMDVNMDYECINRCLVCGIDIGECNPRQYCCKTFCPMQFEMNKRKRI